MWEKVKPWLRRYVLAPLPAFLLIAGAVILVVLGVRNVQIGGLLGKLFGHSTEGKKAVDIANTIPDHRVGPDGALIPIGTPDSKGITQATVHTIESPGIFSNPDTVTIQPPGQDKVVVQLPDGVKSKDDDKVIVVSPEVVAVSVKDTSKVSAQNVDDLLKKYGG